MNFKVDVEMTPEELRKVLGLPDVESFQKEMMGKIQERMDAGVDGYDPLTLFQPYMASGLGSMDAIQKMLLNMMTSYSNKQKTSDKK
ncbi:DUF6489 family protein [Amphritea sp. 2_MG-2023]|jgi:hypothetical protein|uniref:DUF6489 family protein n=1 Tax=Amphritea TaxID=515417 RepID=UPI001C073023|nr:MULTISPECIES: DUF6489 family protein [Amphritea]MBU2964528.1 hypothetical protein [Amphritea atlantica]MDO6417857.1 DUF6489 family protein [Amphritea sp. 2_MG-2023]MDX2422233.1 DUF6489 family protein [Amphritea sp.]